MKLNDVNIDPALFPVLDNRLTENLVSECCSRVFTASGGAINDFSVGSPVRAILEGQAYAQSELLYYLNLVPKSIALHWLQIAGVKRSLATKAVGTVRLRLNTVLSSIFALPIGTVFKSTGGFLYKSTSVLTIPQGEIEGECTIQANGDGYNYNAPVSSITSLIQPVSNVRQIYNVEPIGGGRDAETDASLEARGYTQLHRRGLITAQDFADEVRELLGDASQAWVIRNLKPDLQSYGAGYLTVFCCYFDGTTVNETQLKSIEIHLNKKAPIGSYITVAAILDLDVQIDIYATYYPSDDGAQVANNIFDALRFYVSPAFLPMGESLKLRAIESIVQSYTANCGSVVMQELNNTSTAQNNQFPRLSSDLGMPTLRHAPKLAGVTLHLERLNRSAPLLPQENLIFQPGRYETFYWGLGGVTVD
jgi:uncharacterized phage protein gp47/JayE